MLEKEILMKLYNALLLMLAMLSSNVLQAVEKIDPNSIEEYLNGNEDANQLISNGNLALKKEKLSLHLESLKNLKEKKEERKRIKQGIKKIEEIQIAAFLSNPNITKQCVAILP